ncbi:hypothetical protein NP493_585g01008 [Ridgeia piscesae]|uniref:Uncharacterized protein n=1 Tax=Ridgeia piscesae TaxID=27915 RepID=A0AAD9NPK8_RIDPI|nr:hypothetical protein NP493_585g01008 [Ridgeia piscesae]
MESKSSSDSSESSSDSDGETVKNDDSQKQTTNMLHLNLHQCARERDVTKLRQLLKAAPHSKEKLNEHDREGLSPLHYAARYDRFASVVVLVKAGADVNDKDDDGATPLHCAARYRHKEGHPKDYEQTVISYLVANGAKINAKDKDGTTPLHFAVSRGSKEACEELVNFERINIEAKDHQKMRALHLAATHKNEEIVEILLSKGAKVRCFDNNRRTPLYYACKEDAVGVAERLIKQAEKQGKKDMVSKASTIFITT